MPTISVRLTGLEAMLLDLLALEEMSRGQVIREALHRSFESRLLLSPEQRRCLRRELVVRRRPPNRRFEGAGS
jgi:hypothetical protein